MIPDCCQAHPCTSVTLVILKLGLPHGSKAPEVVELLTPEMRKCRHGVQVLLARAHSCARKLTTNDPGCYCHDIAVTFNLKA